VAGKSFASTLCLAVALGAPFLLVGGAARRLVEPLTHAAVEALLRVSAPLQAAPSEPPAQPFDDEVEAGAPVFLSASGKGAKGRGRRAAPAAKPSAVFVSEAAVLKLAQGSARPQGSFVTQSSTHPAGLRLTGVAALGIGVQDGDILIEALGVTPQSPGQVIGAVIEARARHARYLSGTLWRRGQTFSITVEQPYLAASPALPAAVARTP
jgi:hypothetical protein